MLTAMQWHSLFKLIIFYLFIECTCYGYLDPVVLAQTQEHTGGRGGRFEKVLFNNKEFTRWVSKSMMGSSRRRVKAGVSPSETAGSVAETGWWGRRFRETLEEEEDSRSHSKGNTKIITSSLAVMECSPSLPLLSGTPNTSMTAPTSPHLNPSSNHLLLLTAAALIIFLNVFYICSDFVVIIIIIIIIYWT